MEAGCPFAPSRRASSTAARIRAVCALPLAEAASPSSLRLRVSRAIWMSWTCTFRSDPLLKRKFRVTSGDAGQAARTSTVGALADASSPDGSTGSASRAMSSLISTKPSGRVSLESLTVSGSQRRENVRFPANGSPTTSISVELSRTTSHEDSAPLISSVTVRVLEATPVLCWKVRLQGEAAHAFELDARGRRHPAVTVLPIEPSGAH